MKPNFANSYLHVNVNSAAHGAFSGRVTGPRLAAPLFFEDFSGMLLLVDNLLDEQNYPRAYQRKRTFAASPTSADLPAGPPVAAAEKEKSGEYARSFTLHITSRHNASWQGMIDWQDDRAKQPFASDLELLRLLEQELVTFL